jgi:adenosine kinase
MATPQYQLLCLENPLLDIQGQGYAANRHESFHETTIANADRSDDALLKQYELKANDAILAEEKHMTLYEELIQNRKAQLLAGGAAQNTARGAQYLLPPDSTVFFGCVGKDKYSEILDKANKEAGLATRYLYDAEQPTGRCGVIITGHNRSMCTDLAAANHYKVEHLKEKENWEVVRGSNVYFVGGYHLTVCVPAAMALAEEAARENKVRLSCLCENTVVP